MYYYVRMCKVPKTSVVWDRPHDVLRPERFPYSVFRVGRTQWVLLSAAATQNRVKNAATLLGVPNDVRSKLQRPSAARRRHSVG